MVALNVGSSVDGVVTSGHVGNVVLLGGWNGSAAVAAATSHVQSLASGATGGIGFLVAADQEGGQIRQLRGPGFTALPSALVQGAQPSATRTGYGSTLGSELKAAGVNVDFAPVADTVSASLGTANGPIGKWQREYGNDPATVGAAVSDVVRGMRDAGIQATLKHFPGLGRVTGNTDFTASGIVDSQTSATDAYLGPFQQGIDAGAGLVMTSTATYPKIDGNNPAAFSSAVVNGVLRGNLGFGGVVITDDLNAASVRAIPAGQKAIRVVSAGGDISLTGVASDGPVMVNALVAQENSDPSFAAAMQRSVTRVVTLKAGLGLVPGCGG